MNDIDFLLRVKTYIENTESFTEDTRGKCTPLVEMISAGDMPELYFEVLEKIASRPTQRPLDEVHAERTMSMSCPSCHHLIEVVLLASLRQ